MIQFLEDILGNGNDNIIREYVNKINQEEALEAHPWMRENILRSDLYACTLNGKPVLLEDLLFGEESVSSRQNIIVVVGEKHIGKKYFMKKLLEVCKESVENEQDNFKTKMIRGNYRIPVAVPYEWYQKFIETPSLGELVTEVIARNIDHINEQKTSQLMNYVEKLLDAGRFLIYFEGEYWLRNLEEDLKKILLYGKIREPYNQKAKYHNLVFLTVDSAEDIKNSFLNEQMYVSIQLNKLDIREVEAYLSSYLPKLLAIVKKEKDAMEMLRYPAHLKMFESLGKNELVSTGDEVYLSNAFDFYDYFIRANIRKNIVETKRSQNAYSKEKEEFWFLRLQEYAAKLYSGQSRKGLDKYLSGFDFQSDGLLNQENEFIFPLCGYYLTAKYLVRQLETNQLNEIPVCLLEEPLELILLWVSRMITDVSIFDRFWNLLYSNPSCKLLLLTKVVRETPFMGVYLDAVFKRVYSNLRKEFYDYTFLEALGELQNDGVTYLKKEYSGLEDYDEVQRNNIKKRSVYFLGISHNGIIEEMLKEFMEDHTDLHLKYHIIRAAVENYGVHEESTKLIDNYFESLENYCGSAEDPIICSDFCVLYKKKEKEEWMARKDIHKLTEKLKEKMEDQTYWVRAHAAGAIGRREIDKAYELLLKRIKCELELIYEKAEGYRNSIKVISYSVEAICELSDRLKSQRERQVVSSLFEMLNMEHLGDRDIEDAYSTIATGIEYLINADTGKLPFNLGGRFRNRTISYQKVLRNTFQELKFYMEGRPDIQEEIQEKIRKVELNMSKETVDKENQKKEPSKKIKILQLSDLHYTGSNSDNNLIVRRIKTKLKNIDMIVVTGDLREYGQNYDQALKILKDLVQHFGLRTKDVFIVPGNHDCDGYEKKEKIFEDIRKEIYHDKEIYKQYRTELYQGFQSYEKFLEDFYGQEFMQQGSIHNQLLPWKDCLQILCMNTALLCDSETKKDKIVDIAELTEIQAKSNAPVLCISHHKLDQLYLDHEDTVKAVFEDLKVSAMLSGDIHRSKVEKILLDSNEISNFICGKLLGDTADTWSKRNIAVYELDLEEKTMTAALYKWNGKNLEPDYAFQQSPEDGCVEGEWKKIKIDLL